MLAFNPNDDNYSFRCISWQLFRYFFEVTARTNVCGAPADVSMRYYEKQVISRKKCRNQTSVLGQFYDEK